MDRSSDFEASQGGGKYIYLENSARIMIEQRNRFLCRRSEHNLRDARLVIVPDIRQKLPCRR